MYSTKAIDIFIGPLYIPPRQCKKVHALSVDLDVFQIGICSEWRKNWANKHVKCIHKEVRQGSFQGEYHTLVESIGKGRLPNLQSLLWESTTLREADAKSVVGAYYADHSLTTKNIDIPWDSYTDLSLETKLKINV